MTARPEKRTRHVTMRLVGTERGRRRRATRGQWSDTESTGKSPIEMSTLPAGTEGVPSCVAASAGNGKFPASSHAAGRAPATPGPTEPDHPRASGMHRTGPQLRPEVSRFPVGRAESVSADPNAPSAISNATALVITPTLRRWWAYESRAGRSDPSGNIATHSRTLRLSYPTWRTADERTHRERIDRCCRFANWVQPS